MIKIAIEVSWFPAERSSDMAIANFLSGVQEISLLGAVFKSHFDEGMEVVSPGGVSLEVPSNTSV